jgi:chromosome segregation ATPase
MTQETQSNPSGPAKRFRSPNRPKSERLAEAQAKAARLAASVAAQECSEHPEVQAIDAQIKEANKTVINLTRHAKEGVENAENFDKRAAEWRERAATANQALPAAKDTLSALKEQRRAVIASLAQGGAIES